MKYNLPDFGKKTKNSIWILNN